MRYVKINLRVFKDDHLWTAESAELGVASCGRTPHTAVRHAQEACALQLEGLLEVFTLKELAHRYNLQVTEAKEEAVSILVPLAEEWPRLEK